MKHQGQALIIAVIVLFLLVGLGGYFVSLINASLVQSARIDDKRQLDEITRAGLDHARNQLRFSSAGADWRPDVGPDPGNIGWIRYDKGFYKITVTYGPQAPIDSSNPFGQNLTDSYMKIAVCSALALQNPPDPAMEATAGTDEYQAYLKGFQNPQRFLRRSIAAMIPVGLTDNLIWLTNIDGSSEPMVLGSGLMLNNPAIPGIQNTADTFLTTITSSPNAIDFNNTTSYSDVSISSFYYRPVYEGPIYAQGDLQLGGGWFYLLDPSGTDADNYKSKYAVQRNDQIKVTHSMTDYGEATASVMLNIQSPTEIKADANRVTASTVAFIRTLENDKTVPKINAPKINEIGSGYAADRYRRLTRDSGTWTSGIDSGELGYGDGLYIDNRGDRQFGGDIDALRNDWLHPEKLTYWKNGIYRPDKPGTDITSTVKPRAVTIILRDWKYDSTGNMVDIPRLELRRYDKAFKDSKGVDLTAQTDVDAEGVTYYWVEMPYPKNGIIFAEGNVIVINERIAPDPANANDLGRKGGLPSSIAYDIRSKKPLPVKDSAGNDTNVQAWGGQKNYNTTTYYINDYNRRFDLSIVSGGTAYIQSNLLNPASRMEKYISNITANTKSTIVSGTPYDSKLALFALDNVCFNPTPAMFTPPVLSGSSTLTDGNNEKVNSLVVADTATLSFNTAGRVNQSLRMLLRHGYDNTDVAKINSVVKMQVNNQDFKWNNSNTLLTLTTNAFNSLPLLPASWRVDDSLKYTSSLPVIGYGADNTAVLTVNSTAQANYILGAGNNETSNVENNFLGSGMLVTGQDMQIDALIYAQRGHWFVIPGHYYNESTALQIADMKPPFPRYHEPLDVRFILNGAIVENRPAPQEDEDLWMSHWRGSNYSYYSTDSKTPAMFNPSTVASDWDQNEWRWRNRRMGIEYHYDATLSLPVCFETETDQATGASWISYRPRIPKMPVADNLLNYNQIHM